MQRVKLALAGKDGVDIGHFQWINLDMIKNEVGEQWIAVRKKIYNVAAQYIEKRLSDSDVLLRCRGGFIIVYAALTGKEAIEHTRVLTNGINQFFLGDRILKNLEISAATTTLEVSEFAEFLKRSDLQAAAAPDASSGSDKPARTESTGRNPASGWRSIDRRNPTGGPPGSAAPDAGRPSPASGTASAPAVVPDFKGAVDATAELQDLTSLPFDIPEAHWDEIVFKPCWDAKFQYITANFCLPRRTHKGATLYGGQTLLGNNDPILTQTMDHAVAVTAQRGFLKQLAAGKKCAVVMPVHYSTVIGTQDRIRYFSILQNVPQRARKYFYIRVDEIPDGAPIGQMEELFRSMCIFGSNLLAKIPPGTVQLDRFDNCSIAIYSTSLQRSWAQTGLSDAVVKKLVDQAISIRRKAKRAALTQVDTLDELRFGLDAGYEIFSGAAIGADRGLPSPLVERRLEDLASGNQSAA